MLHFILLLASARRVSRVNPGLSFLGHFGLQIANVKTEHRLEAYATFTPSRRHFECTAIALGMALTDRSKVRKAM